MDYASSFFASLIGKSREATMLSANMPRMTNRDVPGPISISKNVLSNILTPMNDSSTPKPVFSLQNMFITLLSMKKRERSPMMAKMFEKNTM